MGNSVNIMTTKYISYSRVSFALATVSLLIGSILNSSASSAADPVVARPSSPDRLAQAIHSLNDLPRNWQGISGNAIELNTGSLLIDKSVEISRTELTNGFRATYSVKGRFQIAQGRLIQLKTIMLWVNYDEPAIIEMSLTMDDPLVMGYSAGVRYDKDLNRYNLADFPVNGVRSFVFSAPAN